MASAKTPKILAGLLLLVCIFLPLYSAPESAWDSTTRIYTSAFDILTEEWSGAVLVSFAFLWPILTLLLDALSHGRGARWIAAGATILLALFSTFLIVGPLQFSMQLRMVLFFMIPVGQRIEVGTVLALLANAVYIIAWVVSAVRAHRDPQVGASPAISV